MGLSNSLVLGFGEKIYYKTKYGERFNGEWEIRTIASSWRVNKYEGIFCGDYGEEEEIDKSLKNLLSQKLLNIGYRTSSDIELTLDNGIKVSFYASSSNTSRFELFIPNNIYIEFDATNNWLIKNANESGEGLSYKEKLLNAHSEECFNRWEKIIPKCNGENYCHDCVYYRPLRGEFYFWDYGICSNKKSDFDANLVGIKSGCMEFRKSLEET